MTGDGDKGGHEQRHGTEGGGTLRGVSMLASMGITMVACTFIGLLIGIYIDRHFDTNPWFTLIFLILGIAAGFKNIYTAARKHVE
ncbi:MAG: AtpZ/AtpI family protein [Deltaproteobacteria bacterium]|nr:AtpZ/AtpI family protein [Deltaproteobacteria bacterium]